jgi:hypothetical protein
VPALQAQSPEFKPQSTKKKKKWLMSGSCLRGSCLSKPAEQRLGEGGKEKSRPGHSTCKGPEEGNTWRITGIAGTPERPAWSAQQSEGREWVKTSREISFFWWWWCCGLNSGFHTCWAGTLPLEPLSQPERFHFDSTEIFMDF